jgi:hypothetical protein
MNPYLFHAGWYVTSLTLFLIALGFGPIVLSPRSKPIKALLKNYTSDNIPPEYYKLAKKLCINGFEAILRKAFQLAAMKETRQANSVITGIFGRANAVYASNRYIILPSYL